MYVTGSSISISKHVACNFSQRTCRGLQAAVDGLRGEGPLVSVQLDVRNDTPLHALQTPTQAASVTPDPPAKPEGPMTGPLTKSLSRSVFSPDRRRGTGSTPPSDSVLPYKGMGLLARLGFCRRPFSDDEAEVTVAPKPAPRPILPDPYVRIRIKVSCPCHCLSNTASSSRWPACPKKPLYRSEHNVYDQASHPSSCGCIFDSCT